MMRPTFRLQRIQNWIVNVTPSRIDSLPYSKIKSLTHKYRQRLLASRTAPVAPTPLDNLHAGTVPPASIFICQPTPSYVLSPQLAATLTKSDISALKSKLSVYQWESVPAEGIDVTEGVHIDDEYGVGDICAKVVEQDCLPEFIIDEDLGGDRALYYGHGQIHFVGMVDMYRTELKKNLEFFWSAGLQNRLTKEVSKGLPIGNSKPSVANTPNTLHRPESWILCNTKQGKQKFARAATHIDYADGIATTAITLDLAVPVPGVDPDRTCPRLRLAAAGIETGPFTSVNMVLDGMPASTQIRAAGMVDPQGFLQTMLLRAAQRAMGLEETEEIVDHARAFGEADPDLDTDEYAEMDLAGHGL